MKSIIFGIGLATLFLVFPAAAMAGDHKTPSAPVNSTGGHDVDAAAKPPPRTLACRDYVPGNFLKAGDYQSLNSLLWETDIANNSPGLGRDKRMATWAKPQDAELTAALLEVFTNPKTKVLYGSFDDPKEREDYKRKGNSGEEPHGGDHGTGLRVVYQLEVGGRLISVLAFWKYDSILKTMVPVGGPDGLRVRSEVLPFKHVVFDSSAPSSRREDMGWVGLSYDLDTNSSGKVTGIAPLNYWDEKGARKQPWSKLNPQTCVRCHGATDRDPPRSRVRPAASGRTPHGQNEFLEFVEENQKAPPEVVKGLRDTLDKARTAKGLDAIKPLIPEGLVDILRERCREMASDRTIPAQLDQWLGGRPLDKVVDNRDFEKWEAAEKKKREEAEAARTPVFDFNKRYLYRDGDRAERVRARARPDGKVSIYFMDRPYEIRTVEAKAIVAPVSSKDGFQGGDEVVVGGLHGKVTDVFSDGSVRVDLRFPWGSDAGSKFYKVSELKRAE